jgi:hypothetical protein
MLLFPAGVSSGGGETSFLMNIMFFLQRKVAFLAGTKSKRFVLS